MSQIAYSENVALVRLPREGAPLRSKRVLLFVTTAVIVIALAYLVGYWPERQRRIERDQEIASLQARLAETEARVRLAQVLGDLLNVIDTIEAMNYGEAQRLSSRLFDAAREEADRTPDAAVRPVLQSVVQHRDAVTSALARGDATVHSTLRTAELQLRAALGYPVPRTAGQ
jgi:hypothetical protein